MKHKKLKNSNGITISDSIIMSVKKKRPNFRVIEGVTVAVCGFVATIMSFFSMFEFNYNKPAVVFAAILFSAVYITLALMGKRGVWIAAGSVFIALFACYRYIEKLALGFKYIYNRIYSAAYHTDISYYKFMKPKLEAGSVTAFFILYIWALALVLYIFTIYRPNSIPPLLVTFPVLEIGLYNGMKVSVLWGMMLIGYWFALFAMTNIDIGEYSGGTGGFVRKENLFFPKRQMRLKVTEKCGVMIIAEVLALTALTACTMRVLGYRRSEEINRRRSNIRDAVNSFTIDDIAGSVSNITSAFGFTFTTDTHKLGNVDRLHYKDSTDLIVTVDQDFDGAVYLKEFTGAEYDSDKWTAFPDSVYSDPQFTDFGRYAIHPQDFPHTANHLLFQHRDDYTIWIESKLNSNRSFAPYGTDSLGITNYNYDKDVTSKKGSKNEFSYKFAPYIPEDVIPEVNRPMRMVCFPERIMDDDWRTKINNYCKAYDLLSNNGNEYFNMNSFIDVQPTYYYDNGEAMMTMLMEEKYEDFVYKNYLQLPDTPEMEEIRKEFAPFLRETSRNATSNEKIRTLEALREEVSARVEYSLVPGRTPNNRDFVNYFLLENHKGYCVHYASAGVILARMAGIPARYASGYVIVGDDFNSDNRNASGSYTIEVKDNRSHAWVEVYLNGYGWVPFEFTAGYSQQSIDTNPTTTATSASTEPVESTTTTAVPETTTDDTTETHSPANSTAANTTTAAVTTGATTAVSTGGLGHGSGGGFHITIPPAVKYTIYTVLLAAAFIGTALLRRMLILWLRRKHLSEGDPTKRMRYIYGYAEKLLGIMDIKREGESRMDFAAKVDKALGGQLYPAGGFTACTDAALRAAFSEETPSKAEADEHMKFAEGFAKKLYAESKPLRRFWLKFINVIQ